MADGSGEVLRASAESATILSLHPSTPRAQTASFSVGATQGTTRGGVSYDAAGRYSGASDLSMPWATGMSTEGGNDLISIGSSHSHDEPARVADYASRPMSQVDAAPATFAMYRKSQNLDAAVPPSPSTESERSPSPSPAPHDASGYAEVRVSDDAARPSSNLWHESRNSQLTIKPTPYKPMPPSSWNNTAVDPFADNSRNNSRNESRNGARESMGSMTSTAGRPSMNSVDLTAFPRPPSVNTGFPLGSGSSGALRANRSILRRNSALGNLQYTNSLPTLLQTPSEVNLLEPAQSPQRADFDYAYEHYAPNSNTSHHQSNSARPSDGSEEGQILVDPFSDGLDVPLPSPMASSAARSLFFPQDYTKVEGAYGTAPGVGAAPPSTNTTRVARSWTPSGYAPEEMAVAAGDVVRVISRHSVFPNSNGSSTSLLDPSAARDRNATLGGWALVKKTDPISGIGKRGFVPVNCLMDV